MSRKKQRKEYFDVLYEDGTPSGEQIERGEAHRCGAVHGAAHICIYRRRNGLEVLLQKRSPNKDSYPNCYDMSSAGHVEAGSDFLITAQKELAEELGVAVEPHELVELFDHRVSGRGVFHGVEFINEEICRVYLLERDMEESEFVLQESELCGVKWFDFREVIRQTELKNPDFCVDNGELVRILEHLTEGGQ